MELNNLFDKALGLGFLTLEEGVELYHHAPLADLMFVADELRKTSATWKSYLADRSQCKYNQCMYSQLQVLQLLSYSRPCRSIYHRHACLQKED